MIVAQKVQSMMLCIDIGRNIRNKDKKMLKEIKT